MSLQLNFSLKYQIIQNLNFVIQQTKNEKMMVFCKIELFCSWILFDIYIFFSNDLYKSFYNFLTFFFFFYNLCIFSANLKPCGLLLEAAFLYMFPSRQAAPEICKWELSFSANGCTLTTYSFLTLFPQKPQEHVNFKQSYLNNGMCST